MAYRTVTGTINRIKDNSPWANARVNFILTSFGFNSTDDVIYPQSRTIAVTNASGEFSVSLWVSEASVSEAIYKVIFPSKESHEFFIPAGAGSINIATLLEFYSPANLPVQPSSFLTYIEGLLDEKADDDFANVTPSVGRTALSVLSSAESTTLQQQVTALASIGEFSAIDSAGNTTLAAGTNRRISNGYVEVEAGAGAYTHVVIMPTSVATSGDVVNLNVQMPASVNPTIEIRSGTVGGNLIQTIAGTGEAFVGRITVYYTGVLSGWLLVDYRIRDDNFLQQRISTLDSGEKASARSDLDLYSESEIDALLAAKADISDGVDANFAVPTGNIIVAGAGTAAANGTYEPDGTSGGKARFTKTGGTTGDDSIEWDGGLALWRINSGGTRMYVAVEDVATPDLVVTWQTDNGAAPVPTVTAETSLDITTIGKAIANAADADAVKSLLSIGSIIQSAAVYVSQEGDDLNAGTSIDLPVLTIGEAITKAEALIVAGADGVNIDVMDGGTYTGDIEIPATVHIEAPAATFIGTVAIDANASLTIDKHFAAANNDKMVEHSGGSLGAALYRANIQDGRGVAGTLTGVDNVRNVGGGGKNLFVDVGIMYVTTDGIGVGDVSSGDAGHIHIEIPDLYLAGNNAIGILGSSQGAGSSNIIGSIDHIIAIGSPTATVGISMTAAGASVKLTASEIVADTAYNISNGSLYLACPKITGATVGTPVNRLVGTADLNVYRGQFHFSTPAATTIAVAGTFVKAAGTTTSDALVGMTHADNRLTNTSGETRRFLVQASISITDGTGSKLVNLRLAKDGATIAATQVDANTGAHDLATVSAAWMIELAQTEYVEIWIANETDTANLTVTHGTLTAYSIDS